ncbi:MAG: hypothetical protein GKR88_04495 [Flavobacteriaceae bacterium]|nr:MAG: hypothetical protein GKR88_04495 [Flavobacteriaceae bacterium]
MYKKSLLIVLFALMFIACKKEKNAEIKSKDIDIKGNWYLYSTDSNIGNNSTTDTFDYNEVFFDSNTMYRFSNLGGVLAPLFYKVSRDSLFYYGEENQLEYIGRLNLKSQDNLLIMYQNDTLILYKLINENKLMSEYLDTDITIGGKTFKKFGKSKEEEFLNHFLDRMETCFEKIK